jgi:hypothetical protein
VVGEATVSFDGVTCTYEGPASLPAGALRVTQVAGAVPYYVLVAHLVEGFTIEEAIAWQAEHPGEQPPMIDDFEVIGEGALLSPANVALEAGENSVVCATDDGLLVFGRSLTVGDGS